MKFNEITLLNKDDIERYLKIRYHSLATYSFINIFIWRRLYKIFYASIGDCLCIFFKDNLGCFVYLSPLGIKVKPHVINECFKIMDKFNINSSLSRIENVEEQDLEFYKDLGYFSESKPGDYLCGREALVCLKGDKFKSKRAAYNFFLRNYKFSYEPFTAQDKDVALKLYKEWAQCRQNKFTDAVYQGMLADSFFCQMEVMNNFKELGVSGGVVRINNRLSAYTIGFELNTDTFCILYEIADLSIKGLAQFIFRKFCEELDYKYINIMDDSGLDNLRKVKLSYHPFKVIHSYIIKR